MAHVRSDAYGPVLTLFGHQYGASVESLLVAVEVEELSYELEFGPLQLDPGDQVELRLLLREGGVVLSSSYGEGPMSASAYSLLVARADEELDELQMEEFELELAMGESVLFYYADWEEGLSDEDLPLYVADREQLEAELRESGPQAQGAEIRQRVSKHGSFQRQSRPRRDNQKSLLAGRTS